MYIISSKTAASYSNHYNNASVCKPQWVSSLSGSLSEESSMLSPLPRTHGSVKSTFERTWLFCSVFVEFGRQSHIYLDKDRFLDSSPAEGTLVLRNASKQRHGKECLIFPRLFFLHLTKASNLLPSMLPESIDS